VKGYASIEAPLTNLIKKDSFKWNKAVEEAFNKLKESVTSTLVLASPNFNKPFTMECDASGIGVGIVLMQEERPITFES